MEALSFIFHMWQIDEDCRFLNLLNAAAQYRFLLTVLMMFSVFHSRPITFSVGLMYLRF